MSKYELEVYEYLCESPEDFRDALSKLAGESVESTFNSKGNDYILSEHGMEDGSSRPKGVF